ncbi:MAG: sigma-54 dependent transcriptional regulator [bacterium]
MSHKILIVDDEKKICNILSQILSEEKYLVQAVNSGEEAMGAVERFDPDLILMDQNMPGIDGIETMVRIKEKQPEKTVIIITAYGSIPLAVDAIKKGAYDYISKPFDNDELLIIVHRALERIRLTDEISHLKKQLEEKYSFRSIVGVSPQIQRIFEQMQRVLDTNATVLIQGESGTGKELVAKAIHYHSRRKDKPLVAVNCGAVPVNLLESEFFGSEKGAFTDAKERKIGKFEQANGGTLLLDEIGELPLDAQVKLLRVLDERKITRIGSDRTIPIDVRVIAITNRDLEKEVEKGSFRLDLLYRLNIFTISVPSLRDRKADIPLLIEHFIDKHNKQLGLGVKSVSNIAMSRITDNDWPGNIRDLENAIQSAMITAKSETIHLDDLPLRVRGYPVLPDETDTGSEGLEAYVKKYSEKVEKELILKTLDECNHNRNHTANRLKVSRKTLFNKMRRYGLS